MFDGSTPLDQMNRRLFGYLWKWISTPTGTCCHGNCRPNYEFTSTNLVIRNHWMTAIEIVDITV